MAAARLRDLCDKLGFDAQIEAKYHVFQRMFTLFEEVLSKHTPILKDRHLDQILLCCAYVIAKVKAHYCSLFSTLLRLSKNVTNPRF